MEAVYTYDAVKVYALAAHQVISNGGDIRNGSEVVKAIIKMRSYPSDILGINVNNLKKKPTTIFISLKIGDNR